METDLVIETGVADSCDRVESVDKSVYHSPPPLISSNWTLS